MRKDLDAKTHQKTGEKSSRKDLDAKNHQKIGEKSSRKGLDAKNHQKTGEKSSRKVVDAKTHQKTSEKSSRKDLDVNSSGLFCKTTSTKYISGARPLHKIFLYFALFINCEYSSATKTKKRNKAVSLIPHQFIYI
ncbi:hypothetical protein AOX59_00710 [Lentibacillus amyloliquefaciens]|uniref:Uncharacterized protein n=1 Tax=Lentibacillus amyloliquefaciens TaxID=1472767 RepID=A0A0U3WBQ8_9BACI|nr:hypothetical protein AOX59_00710 [Lentibacillus amyloliquefaciens]